MNDDFHNLQKEIDNFIEQDDHSTLMLIAQANDLVVPAKLLEAVGRQRDDIVLLAVHAFETAQQWMNEFIDLLQKQVDAANGERSSENMELWPPLPLECMNPNLEASQRLKLAAQYCGEILPEGERVIWVLLPHDCKNISEYQQMVAILCGDEPWLDDHRFFIWEEKTDRSLLTVLIDQQNEDVLYIELDFSTAKLFDNLVKTVEDPSQPENDRIEALYQLAAVDFAYQRYEMAYEKYSALFNYYEGKDKSRQALCMLGSGDIAMQQNSPSTALTYYQSGLALAMSDESLPAVLPLLIAAGKANMALANYPDAEGYFENANQIAAKLMNPYVKADMLEQRGVAQYNQQKGKDAIESWQASAGLSEKFVYQERWNSALDRLKDLYKQIGDRANYTEVVNRQRKGMQTDDDKTKQGAGEVTA